ncbi:MAG: FecR domain-containing protein [Candidatus Rokubacteria bacterium]|nr:FecR domain-containing protein [Candidatus Rokubacteria bacterium]
MGTLFVRGVFAVALLLTAALPAWAQDAKGVGVVTALTGRADLKRLQVPQAEALKLRDNLYVRDVVDTHKESLARILLLGKSTVTVRELSRFEIREEVRPDGTQRAIVDLAAGKIRVMVARRLMKPGDEVQVRTSNAVASVRGSDGIFEVTTLPDGKPQTSLLVASGQFEVTTPSSRPIAMAETASDAPSAIWLAQAPGLQIVGALEKVVVTGVAGLQQVQRLLATIQEVQAEIRGFTGPSVASGTSARGEPDTAVAAVEAAAVAIAQAQTLSAGTGDTTTTVVAPTQTTTSTTSTSDVITPVTTTDTTVTTAPPPEEPAAPPEEECPAPCPPGHAKHPSKGKGKELGKGHQKFDSDTSLTTSGIISVLDATKLKIHSGPGGGIGSICAHSACAGGGGPPICPPGLAKKGGC